MFPIHKIEQLRDATKDFSKYGVSVEEWHNLLTRTEPANQCELCAHYFTLNLCEDEPTKVLLIKKERIPEIFTPLTIVNPCQDDCLFVFISSSEYELFSEAVQRICYIGDVYDYYDPDQATIESVSLEPKFKDYRR